MRTMERGEVRSYLGWIRLDGESQGDVSGAHPESGVVKRVGARRGVEEEECGSWFFTVSIPISSGYSGNYCLMADMQFLDYSHQEIICRDYWKTTCAFAIR